MSDEGWMDAALEEGTIARSGPWLHLPTHAVTLDAAEQTLADALLPSIAVTLVPVALRRSDCVKRPSPSPRTRALREEVRRER